MLTRNEEIAIKNDLAARATPTWKRMQENAMHHCAVVEREMDAAQNAFRNYSQCSEESARLLARLAEIVETYKRSGQII